MIDPPQVRPEEPTAVTPHGGIRGGESQQWLSYPTCDRRSRYELASASLVRPKPSRQGGSESCGRRGNAGSEA